MTYLCAAIFVSHFDKAQRDIAAAVEAGADMVELRLDEFAHLIDVKLSKPLVPLVPLILTCRPVSEGGRSGLSEEARLKFLRDLSQFHDYVDVELSSYQRAPSAIPGVSGRLIMSAHDF